MDIRKQRILAAALTLAALGTGGLAGFAHPADIRDRPLVLRQAAEGRSAPLNINEASAEELMCLPGIGQVLAAAIIDFREENGPFASCDDLISVSGIGPATLAGLLPYVTC